VSGNTTDGAPRQLPIGAALLHIQSWLTGRDDEFTKWCDELHHFEALQAPGFLACRRFEVVPGYEYAAADGAGYLTVYQLADATAVDSEAHQAVVAAMTPPPAGLMDDVTFTSTVYREHFPVGGWMTPGGEVASGDESIGTAILHVMMDVDPAWDDELNAWYAEEHLPRLLEVPGMLAARRFVDAHWAGGQFSGDGDAARDRHHQYLATYELVDADVVTTPEYARAAEMTPRTAALAPHLSFFSQIYREVFAAGTRADA
jgi:hypothetical protein